MADIVVYDVNGKEILKSALSSGLNEIKTNSLKPSIYYYHIVVNGEIKQANKIVIL